MTPPPMTSRSDPVGVVGRDVVVELVGMRGDLADLHGDLQLLVAMIDALLTLVKRMAPPAPPTEDTDGPRA